MEKAKSTPKHISNSGSKTNSKLNLKLGSNLKSNLNKRRPPTKVAANTPGKQIPLLDQKFSLQYGGTLRTKAKNRGARPLSLQDSMHLVLRSSQAKNEMSFRNPKNFKRLGRLIQGFSPRKGVRIISLANVGNHLHLHIKITNRTLYKAWIRGISSAIAMLVAGRKKLAELKMQKKTFWDYRPFSRVIRSFKAFLNLKDYIEINQLEGVGIARVNAVRMIEGSRVFFSS